MREVPAHTKKRKIRRRGRHTTPSPAQKVVRRAGMAAPAVAVVGALAATPQVRALIAPAPASAASQVAARIGDPASLAISNGNALASHQATSWSQRAKSAHTTGAATAKAVAKAKAKARAKAAAARQAANLAESPTSGTSTSGTSGSSAPTTGSSAPQCSADAGGLLPENFAAIVGFLTTHGYSNNAAAGIAGNIYQESGGNPESGGDGGGGLIGWTPLPSGYVTGDPAADLQTQLEAVLTFNNQWSQFLPALNDAGSPAAAADVYVTDFERAGIPAAGTREASAEAVAAACHL